MKGNAFLVLIELLDERSVAIGNRSAAKHIAKLRDHLANGGDLDSAVLGFRVAAAIARADRIAEIT